MTGLGTKRMRSKIEALNKKIQTCTNCRLSETRTHVLCGEGNLDARLMLVAQAPGIKEDKENRMFIGPSGKVLDDLLEKHHVRREDLYMTNLIKCMLPNYRKPKQDEIDICSMYLDEEIKLIDPAVLVPLGHYATKYLLEKYNLEIPPKKDFYQLYGNLVLINNRKILPLQHPAALVHTPTLKEVLLKNYHKLQVLLRDCKWYQICPMKTYYERGILDKKWVELYCKGDWESCVRYNMEECGKQHADYMLPDGTLDKKLEKL
jgi:uracil-DNA glycosylase family 4